MRVAIGSVLQPLHYAGYAAYCNCRRNDWRPGNWFAVQSGCCRQLLSLAVLITHLRVIFLHTCACSGRSLAQVATHRIVVGSPGGTRTLLAQNTALCKACYLGLRPRRTRLILDNTAADLRVSQYSRNGPLVVSPVSGKVRLPAPEKGVASTVGATVGCIGIRGSTTCHCSLVRSNAATAEKSNFLGSIPF
jgi:hypothetical protein